VSYTIVSSREASPSEGRLSIDSPVAGALRGRRAGDVALVHTPRGERRYKVVSVS
jgi:transcription elongation factor GreA